MGSGAGGGGDPGLQASGYPSSPDALRAQPPRLLPKPAGSPSASRTGPYGGWVRLYFHPSLSITAHFFLSADAAKQFLFLFPGPNTRGCWLGSFVGPNAG